MNPLSKLSDQLLIDTYVSAINLSLSEDFIKLLQVEIDRRNLYVAYNNN